MVFPHKKSHALHFAPWPHKKRTIREQMALIVFAVPVAYPGQLRHHHRLGSDRADKMALMRQLKDAEICADVQVAVEYLHYHHRVDGCDGRRGF